MTPTVVLRATLFGGGELQVRFYADRLKAADGLPSGRIFHWEMTQGGLQRERRLLRPYYRRIINGELNIFATQVMPKEEKRRGR